MKHRLVVSSLFIYLSFGNGIGIGIVSESAWIRFRSFVNVNSKQVYSLNDLEQCFPKSGPRKKNKTYIFLPKNWINVL
jgi:hypothetical protein